MEIIGMLHECWTAGDLCWKSHKVKTQAGFHCFTDTSNWILSAPIKSETTANVGNKLRIYILKKSAYIHIACNPLSPSSAGWRVAAGSDREKSTNRISAWRTSKVKVKSTVSVCHLTCRQAVCGVDGGLETSQRRRHATTAQQQPCRL